MRKLGIAVVMGLVVGCGGAAGRAPMSAAPSDHAGADESAPAAPGGGAAPAGYPRQPMAPPAAEPKAEAATAAPAVASKTASASPAPASASPASGSVAVARPEAPPPPPPVPPREAQRLPQAGQLTAGIWDDNRNFEFFRPYAVRFTEQHGSDFAMFTREELELARVASTATSAPRTELDVQLVLDTTGSMGDELGYLQSEFDSIATQVRAKFPNVVPRWSLVVYRDHGDDYVTRGFDFSTDTTRFRANLRAQSAGGGGDTPEAVVEGIQKGLDQQWRTSSPNVAKIAFWVADAPAHPGEGQKLARVIRAAKSKGVHIYPVASSDTDDAAEYQMRAAAQMTAGRYVFLTNDSGIGNSHAEPHIPCYNVSRLDHAIVRMIEVELSGRFAPAEPEKVVRTVGRPDKEGKCKLSSGMLVASY